MSKTKHTPGPWKMWGNLKDDSYVRSPERTVAVCLVYRDDNEDELEANARMLAAAPKMAELMRDCLFCFEAFPYSQRTKKNGPLVKRLRSILKTLEATE